MCEIYQARKKRKCQYSLKKIERQSFPEDLKDCQPRRHNKKQSVKLTAAKKKTRKKSASFGLTAQGQQQSQRHRGLAASSIKEPETPTSTLQQEHLKLARDKKAAGTLTVSSVNMANNPGLKRNATSLL